MRALEVALVLPVGAGERALLVAEELSFDQLRRHRAAVERKERSFLSSTQVVHGLRGEPLPVPLRR